MTFDLAETRRICEAATKPHIRQTEEFTHKMTTERWRLIEHALVALPAACDVIEALCEMLDERWWDGPIPEVSAIHPPAWITVALARKQAREASNAKTD